MALYGAETWTLQAADQKYLEGFEMWWWRSMDKITTCGKTFVPIAWLFHSVPLWSLTRMKWRTCLSFLMDCSGAV
jgi:hypothetical protein